MQKTENRENPEQPLKGKRVRFHHEPKDAAGHLVTAHIDHGLMGHMIELDDMAGQFSESLFEIVE